MQSQTNLYKYEIYISDNEHGQLNSLDLKQAEFAGLIPLHTSSRIPHLSLANTVQSVESSSPRFKFELFSQESPAAMRSHIRSCFPDARVSALSCSRLIEYAPVPGKEKSDKLITSSAISDTARDPINCSIQRCSDTITRIKIEHSASNRFLLACTFAACKSQVTIISGKKFRQGISDFAALTFESVAEPRLKLFMKTLTDTLQLQQSSAMTISEKLSAAPDVCFSAQKNGSLITLTIRCPEPSPFLRHAICAILYSLDVDIPLARFSSARSGFDDVYHVKPQGEITSCTKLEQVLTHHFKGIRL